MTFINPSTGWFKIVEVPLYNSKEVKIGSKKYVNKTSVIMRQLFNNTRLSRFPIPRRVVFDNDSKLKMDCNSVLKDFDIKPVFTTIEKPQANIPVKRLHQVIHNMIFIKDIIKKYFDYIDSWGQILTSVAWDIR